MALYIWLLLLFTLVAQGCGYDLKWPSKFTVKVTKISLTTNLIEDYQMWKTQTRSRLDYNDGEVISIRKLKTKKKKSYIKKYDIYPEAFLNQSTYTVCYYKIKQSSSLHDTLPDTDNLVHVGEEAIRDKDTIKYEYVGVDDEENIQSKETLWAIYNIREKYWYPVRTESLIFNTELGYKSQHEILEFYEFSTDFSQDEVFNMKSYDCKESPEDDEEDDMTKKLLLIDPERDNHVDHVFNKFKMNYGIKYGDEKEHEFRKRIFQRNMRRIVETNNKNLGYKLTINKFADKTPKEMKKYMGLRRRPQGKTGNVPFPYTQSKLTELSKDLPKEYDLRLYGLVSAVKNQDDCGSCWAFATAAVVEGALARANGGRLLALAEQAVLDCGWAFGVSGCGGGDFSEAFEWMMKYGLPTTAEYGPYKNRNGICNIKNMTKLYPIRGYTDVTPLSVEALKIALINHGPIAVGVHASDALKLYSSGIFYDPECSQTELSHAMTLVGYGEHYGETFWILKNSWGPTWGIDGYMHISAKDNVCGIATEPTFVII